MTIKPSVGKVVLFEINGRRYIVDHSMEENVPLFDWRLHLTAADEIIERVAAEKKRSSASKIKAVKGLSLEGRRESIARLLADVREAYIEECTDFEFRNSPDKPPRHQKDVPAPPQGPETIPEAIRVVIENLEDCQDCEDRSDALWLDLYGRPRSNPGKSRSGGPPIAPVHDVYTMVRRWWQSQGLGKFHPTFNGHREVDEAYDEAEFNAPSRFLLGVLRCLNRDYTAKNAYGLYETMRKKNKHQS